jgi:hypothetical protein
MFVDHDQARIAGRISERWQLGDGGRVSVIPGGGPGAQPARDVVVIELTGLEPDSVAQLRDLPGVLSCDGTTIRLSAGSSDDVLRRVLSWDGVHVVAVRTESAARR